MILPVVINKLLILLLILKACRGEKLDAGVVLNREGKTEVDSSNNSSYKIPKHADFLIFFSTYDGKFRLFLQCI